ITISKPRNRARGRDGLKRWLLVGHPISFLEESRLVTVQALACFLMEVAIASDDIGSMNVEIPVPIGDSAACFFDNRFEWRHIPGVHTVLDHEFAGTLGHQHITVEIAVATHCFHSPHQIEEGVPATVCEVRKARVKQDGAAQLRKAGDVEPAIVPVSTIATKSTVG